MSYELSQDESSLFSYRFNDCGYKYDFSRNLILVIAISLVLFIILACTYYYECKKTLKPVKVQNFGNFEGGEKDSTSHEKTK